jgi:hypothetical protein
VNDWQFKEALYRLLPRIRGGGGTSMGGTRANDDQELKTVDYRLPKRDRLIASLDEFWFRPDRSRDFKARIFSVSFRGELTAQIQDPSTVDQNLNMDPQTLGATPLLSDCDKPVARPEYVWPSPGEHLARS